MRPLPAVVAILMLGASAAAIVAGGRITGEGAKVEISNEDVPTLDMLGDPPADQPAGVDNDAAPPPEPEPATGQAPAEKPLQPGVSTTQQSGMPAAPQQSGQTQAATQQATAETIQQQAEAASRAIDPMMAAPPGDPGALQRIEPRAPLSKLSLAQPKKPPMPDKWKGTPLYQAVAPAAGRIEAKGYSVAVSGVDIMPEDETCTDEAGKSWPCGARARGAFRALIRQRAVNCVVPPEGGRDLISAPCHIGKVDVGEWLVSNGWARPAAGGPYAEAGEKAKAEKRGIFGKAPEGTGLPPAPPPVSAPEAVPSSIIDSSGLDAPASPNSSPSIWQAPAGPAPGGDPTLRAFPPAPAR
ncbi:thermonuclease family protein [Mesorhizobium sp. NPDC059025]|uniref:thermonuclease family protein n=1 Tax=unclassified Mesorhizobium TaxID=325217 RepID=UPI00368C97D8